MDNKNKQEQKREYEYARPLKGDCLALFYNF